MDSWFAKANSVSLIHESTQGRYLVASRDIKKDEVILMEYPYAWAVEERWQSSTCRYCMGFIDPPERSISCQKCNQVIYCSRECKNNDTREHLVHECRVLSVINSQNFKNSIPEDVYVELKLLLRVISRKRTEVLLEGENMTTWNRDFTFNDYSLLQSNIDKYPKDEIESIKYWVTDYLFNMGEYIYSTSNASFKEKIQIESKDELLEMIFRNRQNGYVYGNGIFEEPQGTAIYISASMFNHSCSPNIFLRTLPSDCEDILNLSSETIKIRRSNVPGPLAVFSAAKDIKKGEPLYISYIDNGMTEPGLLEDQDYECYDVSDKESFSLQNRRKLLYDNYLFECKCSRCLSEENEPLQNVNDDQTSSDIIDEEKSSTVKVEKKLPSNEDSEKIILNEEYLKLIGSKHSITTLRGKVNFTVKGFSVQLNSSSKLVQMALVQMDNKNDMQHIPLKHLHAALDKEI